MTEDVLVELGMRDCGGRDAVCWSRWRRARGGDRVGVLIDGDCSR